MGKDLCGNKSSCSFFVTTTPILNSNFQVVSSSAPKLENGNYTNQITENISEIRNPKSEIRNLSSRVFPNPANSSATIEFTNQNSATHLSVDVFGMSGEIIARLFNADVAPNELNTVKLNAESLPNGVYFYRISGGDEIVNGRIVILK